MDNDEVDFKKMWYQTTITRLDRFEAMLSDHAKQAADQNYALHSALSELKTERKTERKVLATIVSAISGIVSLVVSIMFGGK